MPGVAVGRRRLPGPGPARLGLGAALGPPCRRHVVRSRSNLNMNPGRRPPAGQRTVTRDGSGGAQPEYRCPAHLHLPVTIPAHVRVTVRRRTVTRAGPGGVMSHGDNAQCHVGVGALTSEPLESRLSRRNARARDSENLNPGPGLAARGPSLPLAVRGQPESDPTAAAGAGLSLVRVEPSQCQAADSEPDSESPAGLSSNSGLPVTRRNLKTGRPLEPRRR
jgi:hypothetical protein